ncbi:MAG: hypothetical protein ABIH83_00065 [Candidatus Micrarchaeota archaeon]
MKFVMPVMAMLLMLSSILIAQDANATNTTGVVFTGADEIDSPWAESSKICIFVREWVLKGMFLVVLLVFLGGVATISGAAFPEWRNYGAKMVLGPIVAMVLYVLGTQALRFFMGTTICGIGV